MKKIVKTEFLRIFQFKFFVAISSCQLQHKKILTIFKIFSQNDKSANMPRDGTVHQLANQVSHCSTWYYILTNDKNSLFYMVLYISQ